MVTTRFQARQNNGGTNGGRGRGRGRGRANVRDRDKPNVAETPTDQLKLSGGRQQRHRAHESRRESICRSPGERIRVKVTTDGHATDNPTFAKHLGVLVSKHTPFNTRDFREVSEEVKDFILGELKESFDWGHNPNVQAGILNRAGKIHTIQRKKLKAYAQTAMSVEEAYILRPPGIDPEEWMSTCDCWLAEKFQGQSSNSAQTDFDSAISVTQMTSEEDSYRSVHSVERAGHVCCCGAGATVNNRYGSERGSVSQQDLQNMWEELNSVRDYYCNLIREQRMEEIRRTNLLIQRNNKLIEQLQRHNELTGQFISFMAHHIFGGAFPFPPHRPGDDPPSAGEDDDPPSAGED